ncbi:MAG TPA: SusC/RagA family TonB-linked outer membrane protein, partial [Porphyromonadaceae bacterium]|nr:SusC/RagA family TonB-linked outer membrane protein [Porphyromonadaceae bacterium]
SDTQQEDLQLSLPGRNVGLAGRLAYNYDTRYFAEFNFGYNGSERFAENNRFGFFPSGVVGWMISNEDFFASLQDRITALKIRGSYGLAGNDAIGSGNDRFYYLSNVDLAAGRNVNWGSNMNYNPGGTAAGVNILRYANNSIGWEKSYKTNLALEMSHKAGFSTIVELFREKRENILIERVIPNTMGIVPDVKANLGKAKSRGVDIELNYEKSFSRDFWMTGQGTFTYTKNEVIEWEEPDYAATPWRSRVGYSGGQEWGYIAERLFMDEEEVRNSPTQFGNYMAGDIKYRDVNGDGRISELDMVPIGYPTNSPEMIYGFGLSTGYKGVDFSFFFQGTARRSFFMDYEYMTPFLNGKYTDGGIGQTAVIKEIADSYWSEDNRNPYAFWPRLSTTEEVNNRQKSTWYLQDASFIRLKSVELGYTLPDNLLKKFYLSNLRVYVSGTNLFCWSPFKLWDPEMAGNGFGYPLQRVINVGINIGL